MMTHLSPGDPAPNFNLIDHNRTSWTLEDLEGEWTVVYFYPQDDTPGCTKEACAFRDAYDAYKERGIKVFGISADDYFMHSKFVDKYDLPFMLLEDPNREAIQAYGVERSWEDRDGNKVWGARRVTFVLDPENRIAKVYEDVKPEDHAREILRDLDGLMKEA